MHHPTDRIAHTTAFVTPVVEHWLEREIVQWVHPMKDRSDDPSHRGKSVRSWCDVSSDRSFMVDPLSYFTFQPVLHDWCNKCHGMYYPVCGMMHIKEPLLIIGKSSPCGGSRFPLSLSEWFFTICPTPYNGK